MTRWSSQRYFNNGAASNVPKNVLQNAVRTAQILHRQSPNLPPIFTLRHLAHLTDVPYGFLRKIVSRTGDIEAYRVFKLKKKVKSFGKDRFRHICIPHPLLLKAQRWINREILKLAQPHESSFAYTTGGSVLDAAKMHVGCRWMIKLDVSNFFESILEPDVFKVFSGMGYQPLISFELARICTRIRPTGNPVYKNKQDPNLSGLPYMSPEIGHLPQGAATSPALSNLASRVLDDQLLSFATQNKLTYSRYADDITLSSTLDFEREAALKIVHDTYKIITHHGLWPNRAKTQIIPPGARKIVLGLLVDGDRPRLTKEYKAEVRTHIHFLLRGDIGLDRHMNKRGFETEFGLKNFIYGKIAYAQYIEPNWAQKMKDMADQIKWHAL